MKEVFRAPFTLLCAGVLAIFIIPLIAYPKGTLELWLNDHHSAWLDFFFRYITHLGDGTVLALLVIAALFHNYYYSIVVAGSIIVQSVLVSLFKRWIFSGMPRPAAFFPEGTVLNFVPGVEVHKVNSFPSGHTATAFAFFMLLSIIAHKKQPWISVVFFTLGCAVGVSRVYLLQHFVVDVWFGALFGVLSVLITYWLLSRFMPGDKTEALRNNSLRRHLTISNGFLQFTGKNDVIR